jgi:hypothetical protein
LYDSAGVSVQAAEVVIILNRHAKAAPLAPRAAVLYGRLQRDL